jgi:ADP-ribosylation factor-like protein 2
LELEKITGRHWGIFACSAVTGKGLKEGMTWLMEDIASRIFIHT